MNAPAHFLARRRKPAFTLPPNATDAHCHVFGPGGRFRYAPNRRYTPEDAPKEMLRALHDYLGISRAVIVQASCHGTDNAAMMDCLASDPKRYRGVAIVDDSFSDADYDKLHAGGVRGVRFNFIKHLGGTPDMNVFYKVIDRIKGRGWHVVLHLGGADIIPNIDTIRKLPLTFVIDHMGRVPTTDGHDPAPFKALMELARLPNCWIKVCGAERMAFRPTTGRCRSRAPSSRRCRTAPCGARTSRIRTRRTRRTRASSSTCCRNSAMRPRSSASWSTIRRGSTTSIDAAVAVGSRRRAALCSPP